MTTQKQVAANRANARRSTGAKTATGKAVVSGNAIKHGLLSNRILLGGEDAELFGQLRGEMMLALRPVGILEISLAEKIAAALWLNLPNPQQSKVSSNPPSIYRVILRSLMPKFCIGVPRRQRRYVNVWIIIAEFDRAKQIDVLPRHG